MALHLKSGTAAAISGLIVIAGIAATGLAGAQVTAATFKNFHRYPASGLWSQQLSGTRNGVSLGPPQTSTACTGVADPRMIAQLQKLGDTNAASCKTNVIADTERVAEYERTCMIGGTTHVTRSTMKVVDDKTMTIDTRDEMSGSMQTVMHSNVTYLGPCTAAANKPSAAECAELASNMQESAGAEAQCAQAPPAYRAQCLAQIASSRKMMDVIKAQCQ